MFNVVAASSGAALPIAIGAILGVVGCLVFVLRTPALSEERAGYPRARLKVLRRILLVYAVIAVGCLIVAIAVGDPPFIWLTSAVVVLAAIGVFQVRSKAVAEGKDS